MKWLEQVFEGALWNSRFIVLFAVIASIATAFVMFFIATADVWYLVEHVLSYMSPDLTVDARKALHDDTITHIVEVVDGYLLALVMLIFGLGMYELFISDIDQAHDDKKTSSKILVIGSLDDLKDRLAKVILMILIVVLFERALKMHVETTLDLVYLGASIALVGVALYLTHATDQQHDEVVKHKKHESEQDSEH